MIKSSISRCFSGSVVKLFFLNNFHGLVGCVYTFILVKLIRGGGVNLRC